MLMANSHEGGYTDDAGDARDNHIYDISSE